MLMLTVLTLFYRVCVCVRARPVISVNATLDITPQIINPEEKICTLPGTSTSVSW